MGNSLGVVLDNYIGIAPVPCHLQLGATTSIDLSRDLSEKDDAEVVKETFKVVYTVDKATCEVSFTRYGVDQHSNAKEIKFCVQDSISKFYSAYSMGIGTKIWIGRSRLLLPNLNISTKLNTSFDAWGGVVDTEVQLYGSGGRCGLLVVESKKKRREEEIEEVTVAHYFVKSSGSSFDISTRTDIGLSLVAKCGTDIGLSVVAKCRVSNGKLESTLEGPEQHPVSALLYMFDEVYRTRFWKASMCPHCHNKRRGKVFWQSDSEDSDSVSIPGPRATPKNARGVSNCGRFQGNGNGNIFENNVFISKKKTMTVIQLKTSQSWKNPIVTYHCLHFMFSFSIINFVVVSISCFLM